MTFVFAFPVFGTFMPASADDLCLLADLKAWLNIQTSTEDTLLQNLITRGSLQMLRWMNRDHIIATTYTENRDGNDALFILPRNFQLISISSVMVDGVAIPAVTSQVSPGFVFDARKIMLRGGSSAFYSTSVYSGLFQYRFTRGFQNVQLVYQAGYASVPADLQQAAVEGFAYVYRRRTHIGEDASSASGQLTISFSREMLPASVLMTMEQYTRRALA